MGVACVLEAPASADFGRLKRAISYGYDPAGRNTTQTSNGLTTTDRFGGTSDAAVYTTQKTTAGALQQTDVYANAIGDGLNTTVSTTPNSTAPNSATSSAQIIDMLGSVVATIDTTATGNATGPSSFQSFDEYGQPENTAPAAETTIHNFGWAGTANRQTETTRSQGSSQALTRYQVATKTLTPTQTTQSTKTTTQDAGHGIRCCHSRISLWVSPLAYWLKHFSAARY